MTFEETQSTMVDVGDKAPIEAADALFGTSQRVVIVVKGEWPVITGTSQAGFKAVRTSVGGNVVNPVPYAAEVQDGLADRLITAAIAAADPETQRRIEDRITPLFGD